MHERRMRAGKALFFQIYNNKKEHEKERNQ